MTIAFLDSPVMLRHILKEPRSYPHIEKFSALYASELMRVEVLRTIDRLRVQQAWSSAEVATRIRLFTALSAGIGFIPLQQAVLRRASEPFPITVKTLDALHLATALLTQLQLNKTLVFLTHDAKQGLAALASGLEADGFS